MAKYKTRPVSFSSDTKNFREKKNAEKPKRKKKNPVTSSDAEFIHRPRGYKIVRETGVGINPIEAHPETLRAS